MAMYRFWTDPLVVGADVSAITVMPLARLLFCYQFGLVAFAPFFFFFFHGQSDFVRSF